MRLFLALICLAAVAFAQSSAPVIVSASPSVIDAAGPAFTLSVTLNAYVGAPVVQWSGTPLTVTSVNDTTVSAAVPAGLIAICGKYLVTVTSGQTVSNSFPIIVKPVLQSISPNVLPAGSGGTTVTAAGLGFSSNVYLTLNASSSQSNLATAHPDTATLTAVVPTSAFNGTYAVSLFVTDPTTGAVSQTLPITLTYASVSLISPTTITADIASYVPPPNTSFPLQVGGANFVPGAQVLWDGAPLATQYNASNYLVATVPADLVHARHHEPGAASAPQSPGRRAGLDRRRQGNERRHREG